MTIRTVLFDFSGTLFRIESARSWLRAVLHDHGASLPGDELDLYSRRLEAAGALPGGAHPERIPGHLTELWAARDTDGHRHRAAYTGLAREVPLPDEALYDALYDRHMAPGAWSPYPDAAEVLRGLRERDIGVGVVSNIGWDPRPVFRTHGLAELVDTYTLSFEHGVTKPDVRLFRTACEGLGRDPREVLMVGDDRRADGGAADLGCAVHFVDHLPVDDRPAGLLPVLGLVDGRPAP
ncbi:HAD family hydrolase [Streptomyces sp. Tu 2975]|uniref:HAD family hydrolase n=1 Tax=Streptomyces sp. Tu 2975 TaxID=2676871 RepID=UPI00135A1AE5|nr:HAD family hydrolase [Streptomyces sp. Tu 2975]QIP87772.1 HAD family hydrolase [Streptomyces sp. Tu 2975]